MSAIGTIMATAVVTMGVMGAVRAMQRRAKARSKKVERQPHEEPPIDLAVDPDTGLWSLDRADGTRRGNPQ